jgi:hypothetical protein
MHGDMSGIGRNNLAVLAGKVYRITLSSPSAAIVEVSGQQKSLFLLYEHIG